MTNPTPHGQVPEALINLIDAYAETRHRCGGIYNAKTEAARKTVIEALSGVQALSAAPAGWKLVPVEPTNDMQKAADEWAAKGFDWPKAVYRAMLAASPTPPAEQQAQPGAVDRTGCTAGTDEECTRRGCATSCPAQQAAPKAAPGDEGKALAALRYYQHECSGAEPSISVFHRMVDEALEAAPQQEAQEPIGWTTGIAWRSNTRLQSEQVVKITRDAQPMYGYTIPLYTAPQPAPAPLSDDAKRLDWLDRNIFAREMSEWDTKYVYGPGYNMWVIFSPKGAQGSARNIIDAALAAQGGK